ncbi:MAG: tyrosine-type recombinase/integrase [Kineosporiaceae bacterium]
MLIATGLRIGEMAGITWPSLDLAAGTVEVRGTVIRVKAEGLVVKQRPKSRHGWRVVELPSWAVDMLHRRQGRDANPWSVVFPSPTGMLRDPKNTAGDLREAFDAAGYPEVTSHTFRRTVATFMDMAGLSARAAADQLGSVGGWPPRALAASWRLWPPRDRRETITMGKPWGPASETAARERFRWWEYAARGSNPEPAD